MERKRKPKISRKPESVGRAEHVENLVNFYAGVRVKLRRAGLGWESNAVDADAALKINDEKT